MNEFSHEDSKAQSVFLVPVGKHWVVDVGWIYLKNTFSRRRKGAKAQSVSIPK